MKNSMYFLLFSLIFACETNSQNRKMPLRPEAAPRTAVVDSSNSPKGNIAYAKYPLLILRKRGAPLFYGDPRAFIESSGFPMSEGAYVKGFNTLQEANEKYNEFSEKNVNNPYIGAFKQVAIHYIFDKFDLLNQTDESSVKLIEFYFSEYTDKLSCFDAKLCYRLLSKLKNVWGATKLSEEKNKTITYLSQYTEMIKKQPPLNKEKVSEQEINDSSTRNSELIATTENYIDLIRDL